MGRLGRFRDERRREAYLLAYDTVRRRWPVPAEELDIDTHHGTTHVRRCGNESGPPLVLLHPNQGTSLAWMPFIEPLARDHLVLTPDTIGAVGRSVQTSPLTGPDDFGRWMTELLAGLGLDRPAHLVGYSEGGYVALSSAVAHAAPLASLVLIEPGGIAPLRWRFLAGMVWAGVRSRVDRGALRAYGERMMPGVALDDDLWEMAITGAFGFRPGLPFPRAVAADRLRALTLPTLLVLGGETTLYDPDKVARRARGTLAHVEIELYPGARHGLAFEFPERTVDHLVSFVSRHDPTGAPRPESER